MKFFTLAITFLLSCSAFAELPEYRDVTDSEEILYLLLKGTESNKNPDALKTWSLLSLSGHTVNKVRVHRTEGWCKFSVFTNHGEIDSQVFNENTFGVHKDDQSYNKVCGNLKVSSVVEDEESSVFAINNSFRSESGNFLPVTSNEISSGSTISPQ